MKIEIRIKLVSDSLGLILICSIKKPLSKFKTLTKVFILFKPTLHFLKIGHNQIIT